MTDREIVDLYISKDEYAITATKTQYGKRIRKILYEITGDYDSVKDCENECYYNMWNSIPPQRPNFLKLFLAKVTRNLAFTRWRNLSAAKRGGGETALVLEELAGCIPGTEQIDDQLNAKELARVIRAFLDTLPERDQDIFLQRYFFVDDAEQIAARYGLKRTNVNVILSRTRSKLKTYLTQEGYIL